MEIESELERGYTRRFGLEVGVSHIINVGRNGRDECYDNRSSQRLRRSGCHSMSVYLEVVRLIDISAREVS